MGRSQRGQALVEFALTIGIIMFLAVATAQVAVYLHYRSNLQTAAEEGAFEGGLAGNGAAEARATTEALWRKLTPSGGNADVAVAVHGHLMTVDATTRAPALLPIPIHVRGVHTIEQFQPGSGR
jgi:Flp pilus assembly protein TadG